MEGLKTYFFDSYAFFEIIRGNPNYKDFSKDVSLITTKLNLMELYYWILRKKGKEQADKYYQKFLPFCIEISDEVIKKACEFRLKYRKKDFSYVDCIGYVITMKKGILFLTGDIGFSDMENVQYVK